MASVQDALHYALSSEVMTQLTQAMALDTYHRGVETVSAAGALSVSLETTLLSITGTKAYTLANGTYEGQVKIVISIAAASTPAGTLTPTNLGGGTSLAFNAVGDSCMLVWHGTDWWVASLNSVSLS